MKLLSIIKKDFKVLLRSKASGFLVLFGPLLIVLLISLFFNGRSSYDLSIGYHAPEKNELTASFVSALKNTSYAVREFPDEDSCVEKIKQGVIHTCIIFPKDFQLRNENSNELRFLVDYSKMNLVYKVIDSVSGILELESKEVSYSLASILLNKINSTINNLGHEMDSESKISSDLEKSQGELANAGLSLGSINFELSIPTTYSLSNKTIQTNQTLQSLYNNTLMLIEESRGFINMLDDYDLNDSEIDELNYELDELAEMMGNAHNASFDRVDELFALITQLDAGIANLQSNLVTNRQISEDAKAKIASARSSTDNARSGLSQLKDSLASSKSSLQSISINSAETIVSPVNTRIEPIAAESSNIMFTFPFLLILTIMFVALFLSSTITVFEKNSKAVFRNYITPTKPSLLVFGSFITCLIIILCQAIIILAAANYLLGIAVFANALTVFAVALASIIFFIALGMLTGRLFSSQEGAVMASIILGCVFLFASNLVVPLESLAPALSGIIKANPFIIFSDLLRKAILFKSSLSGTIPTLPILFGVGVIILLFLFFSRRWPSKSMPKQSGKKLAAQDLLSELDEAEKNVFVCGEKKARSEKELFEMVSEMTRSEFEDNVNLHRNRLADWVELSLKERKLASRLRKTISKKQTLEILAEDIRKHPPKPEEGEDKKDKEGEKGK